MVTATVMLSAVSTPTMHPCTMYIRGYVPVRVCDTWRIPSDRVTEYHRIHHPTIRIIQSTPYAVDTFSRAEHMLCIYNTTAVLTLAYNAGAIAGTMYVLQMGSGILMVMMYTAAEDAFMLLDAYGMIPLKSFVLMNAYRNMRRTSCVF